MKTSLKAIMAVLLLAGTASCCKNQSPDPVKPPIMGWNSWNAFFTEISDSIICAQADYLVSLGLKDAGYEFVNIDDGFFGQRDAQGNMTVHKERFPGGMRPVVDHIHSLGLKAGIYSDAGSNTCGSTYNNDVNGKGAGLYGHDLQDFKVYFTDWDFDLIKVDYCGGKDLGLDEGTRYREIRENILKSTSKPIVMNVCRWAFPGTWVREIADYWRISPDIRNKWSSIKAIVRKNLYLSAYAGGGHYNDMELLALGFKDKAAAFWDEGLGLSFTEEEAHFGIWCIMSAPLLLSCDLAFLPQDILDLVTNPELLAIDQDPLGLQAHVAWHQGEGYVLVKDILTPHGKTRALAFYNPSDAPVSFNLPLEVAGFKGTAVIRDLGRREDLGTVDHLEATVPAHGAQVLSITGKKRVEPDTYEAEWGFIPGYSDITAKRRSLYEDDPSASAQAVVTGLGGGEEYSIEWNDVFRPKAGKYEIELCYAKGEGTTEHAVLEINGETVPMESNKATVSLRKGDNTVRLSSPEALLPPVDCFTLRKIR